MSAFHDYDDPSEYTDIGHGHFIRFYGWQPDRNLNPQYADLPDVERYSLAVAHETKAGEPCAGGITLDSEVSRRLEPKHPRWTVEKWEPLTLSPSLLCRACGDHGFIKEGRWVPA